jgi:hypothetical protein
MMTAPRYTPPTPEMVRAHLQLTSRRCASALAAIAAAGMLCSGYAGYLSTSRDLTDVGTWSAPLFGVSAAGILAVLIVVADATTTTIELDDRLLPVFGIIAALVTVAVFWVVEPRGSHGNWSEAVVYALPPLLSGVAALVSRFLSLSIRTAISKLGTGPTASGDSDS